MIIEGISAIILGVCTIFFLPNDPETAYFLEEAGRALIRHRRANEYGMTKSAIEFSMKDSQKAFLDWKAWAFASGQFAVDVILYGFSNFLPTTINGLGHWTSAQVQLLTIPCYFVGGISYLTAAALSYRYTKRAFPIILGATSSIIGYDFLVSEVCASVHHFGCFLIATGLYVYVGTLLTWLPNNNPRYDKRTTASGIQPTIQSPAYPKKKLLN